MSIAKHQQMYFITGASRSGTTLLSFVLRNHSRIAGFNELQYFGEYWDPRQSGEQLTDQQLAAAAAMVLARQEQGILSSCPTQQQKDRARALVEGLPEGVERPADLFAELARLLADEQGKAIPCEQTPRNIFYADALLRLYPEAHVIHMMRDPRAVMASQKKRWRRRTLATDKSRFPLRQSLRVWVNYHPYTVAKLWNRASAEALRLKNHPRFTVIRFEDLLQEPERTVRYLCERIGVQYEPAMLDVGQINSSHQSSVGGARKGLHKDAMDTWRNTLTPTETAIVQQMCGELMAHNGYASVPAEKTFLGGLWQRITFLFHGLGVVMLNPRRALIQLRALAVPTGGRHGGASSDVVPGERQ